MYGLTEADEDRGDTWQNHLTTDLKMARATSVLSCLLKSVWATLKEMDRMHSDGTLNVGTNKFQKHNEQTEKKFELKSIT